MNDGHQRKGPFTAFGIPQLMHPCMGLNSSTLDSPETLLQVSSLLAEGIGKEDDKDEATWKM